MNKTISQLEEKIDLKDNDVLLLEDENGTYKVTKENLLKEVKKEQESLKQSVSNGKSLIASAITDKGVTTSNEDTFSVMADNISKIKSSGIESEYKHVSGINKLSIPITSKGMTKNFNLKANSVDPIGVKTNGKINIPVKITNGLESSDDRYLEQELNLNIPHHIYAYNNGLTEVSNEIVYNEKTSKFEFKRNIEISGSERWFGIPFVTFPYSKKLNCPNMICYKDKLYIFGYSFDPRYWDHGIYDCYVLDLKTLEWKQLAKMPIFRFYSTVVAANDKIYLIGGTNGEANLVDTRALEYDINTGKWKQLPDIITYSDEYPAAAFGGSGVSSDSYKGKIYVSGSKSINTFNEEKNKWEILWYDKEFRANFKTISIIDGKAYLYASDGKFYIYDLETKEMTSEETNFDIKIDYPESYYMNGVLYFIGPSWGGKTFCSYNLATKEWKQITHKLIQASEHSGMACDGKENIYMVIDGEPKIAVYNTSYNTFDTLESLDSDRSEMASCVVNGLAYCIGGYNESSELKTNEYYDIATDTWTKLGDMPTARRGLIAEHYKGKIYTIGGNANSVYLKNVECYNIEEKSWTSLTEMPTPRTGMGSVVYENKIYIFGGKNETGYLTSVDCYDIEKDSWSTIETTMPIAKAYFNCLIIGTKVYIIGGKNDDKCVATVDCYDISTNKWTECTNMKNARYGAFAGVLNNAIYVASGYNNKEYLHSVECYHPQTDSWSESLDFKAPRVSAASEVINNRLYVFGGYNNGFIRTTDFFTALNITYLNEVIELEGDYNLPITLGNCLIDIEGAKNAVFSCDVPVLKV